MDVAELSTLLKSIGCPPEKADSMAAQLQRRARQLAKERGRSEEEALTYLTNLMSQGWAAKEKGL